MSEPVFVDGKKIVMRPVPPGREFDALTQLQFAIARYLSADGSFGLYDAGTVITARDEIMQSVSRESIEAIQEAIRSSKKVP